MLRGNVLLLSYRIKKIEPCRLNALLNTNASKISAKVPEVVRVCKTKRETKRGRKNTTISIKVRKVAHMRGYLDGHLRSRRGNNFTVAVSSGLLLLRQARDDHLRQGPFCLSHEGERNGVEGGRRSCF